MRLRRLLAGSVLTFQLTLTDVFPFIYGRLLIIHVTVSFSLVANICICTKIAYYFQKLVVSLPTKLKKIIFYLKNSAYFLQKNEKIKKKGTFKVPFFFTIIYLLQNVLRPHSNSLH
jgi:hypothetical protein